MELCMENSSLRGDSNAFILLAKKQNNKRKGQHQESENVQQNKKPKLSESQKRKLKKLKEKEKALLLETSIENFDKYKIPENAYSLLRSSKHISRGETMREKSRMAVKFSKAGLEVPHSDQSFKMSVASPETEDASEKIHLRQDMDKDDQLLQSRITEREDGSDVFDQVATYQKLGRGIEVGLNAGFVFVSPAEAASPQLSCRPVETDKKNSSPALCGHVNGKISQLKGTSEASLTVDPCKASNLPDCPLLISKPTVVHVVRPNEVEEKRCHLPIVMMEQEIMEAIDCHSSVIICGETGCGKTTQVPQFLYEAGFGSNQSLGVVGVTQPRRVAVLATARRVAYELGLRLGKEVGFQVRHDKRIGENSAIKFMTDGILLREIQNDILLKRYSVIILDEAHERSVNTDILIGMLSRTIQIRQEIYKSQQQMVNAGRSIRPEHDILPLKLVLMSATLRVEDFISGRQLFRDPPPVIEIPTRQFPVTIRSLKKTEIVDYIGQAYKTVLSIHKRLPQGGILVFVTGQREVEYLCRKLCKVSEQLITNTARRDARNEGSAAYEVNLVEGINMKDINEAYNIQGNSDYQETDRFSSYGEDKPSFGGDESDVSYNSESERAVEVADDDDGDSGNQNMLDNDSNLLGVLGAEGNLASLNASFEVLFEKTTSDPPKPFPSENCLGQSNQTTGKYRKEDEGFSAGALHVLPLYAMLPAAVQLRVFEEVKAGERLVVVATNVAETSLTIPGIKYVVDTGRQKVKNCNLSNGMETYEIQWISKASADQRAGRAGRTGPGHCYRLYSSAVFNNILPDFSCPEISKVPVDSIVLLLKSMKIDKVENFPFPTPPATEALKKAVECLQILEALDENEELTPLGKAMAYYPMNPRHSRMLLTVIRIMVKVKNYARANLVLGYAVAAAAALNLSNPLVMQFDRNHGSIGSSEQGISGNLDNRKNLDEQEKLRKKKLKETANVSHAKFSSRTSDALTIAYALHCFELSDNPVEFCCENGLLLKTMEEMSKLRKQLLQLVFNQNSDHGFKQDFSWIHGTIEDVEQTWRVPSSKNSLLLNEEELLGKAICAGWADRVAKRIRGISRSFEGDRNVNSAKYETSSKKTIFLHHSSSLFTEAPEYLVYNELLLKKKGPYNELPLSEKPPYIHRATSVKPEWLVQYARFLCECFVVEDRKPYYNPQTDQVYCWKSAIFKPCEWQLPLYSDPVDGLEDRVKVFAWALLKGHVLPCLRSVCLGMAEDPCIILHRKAAGKKRVGDLVNKLYLKSIDCCATLRKVWKENPEELHSEILNWFKKEYRNNFGQLWLQMLFEVQLKPHERFPEKLKEGKRRKY